MEGGKKTGALKVDLPRVDTHDDDDVEWDNPKYQQYQHINQWQVP